MKRSIAILLVLVLALSLAACGATPKPVATAAPETQEDAPFDYDAVPDTMTSTDGKYEVAFITDVGQLKDKSFNQGSWEGAKRYAFEKNLSYKYYQPANGNQATDDDRYDAMKAAVDGGAKAVVCVGYLQGNALYKAVADFPETYFIFIDGWTLEDAAKKPYANAAAIAFQEEQCGYFAGYAVVMEGFTKLGYSGGGGGTNPAVNRYGYGFVQGAEAAAKQKGVDVSINYSYQYGASYSASPELQTMVNGWYESGTEVVFACGGSMFDSVAAAASANDGYTIGVDVDQSKDSETVVTSAMKGLGESIMFALDKVYTDKWADISGKTTNLGVKEGAVGLPTATWSLKNFTVAQYEELLAAAQAGTLVIDPDYAKLETATWERVTLNIN